LEFEFDEFTESDSEVGAGEADILLAVAISMILLAP